MSVSGLISSFASSELTRTDGLFGYRTNKEDLIILKLKKSKVEKIKISKMLPKRYDLAPKMLSRLFINSIL